MEQRSTWGVIGEGSAARPTSSSTEKHPYIPEKRITEGISEGQKSFLREFNSMRNMLVKHDLMEKK